MTASRDTLDRLARYYLDKLSAAADLTALRSELGQIEKVLDWACDSGQLSLALALLREALPLFGAEGLGDPLCRWAATVVGLARQADDSAALQRALRLQADALAARAHYGTDPGPDLRAALDANNEAFARSTSDPAEEAGILRERAGLLSALAMVAGEDRARLLREALDHSDSALLRVAPDSSAWLSIQSTRAVLLPQLASLPGQDRLALLRQARETFESLLARTESPGNRAVHLTNRANALREIAESLGSADPEYAGLLHEALRSNGEALELYRDQPLNQGEILSSRATLLSLLSPLPGEDGRERLREALAAVDQALPLLRSALPSYARALTNSAMTLARLALLTDGGEERLSLLRRSRIRLDEALALRQASVERASSSINRSSVLQLLARETAGEEREQLLRQALADSVAGFDALQEQQHAQRIGSAFDQIRQVRQAIFAATGAETFGRWWSEVAGRPEPDWSADRGPHPEDFTDRKHSLFMAYIRAEPQARRALLHRHADELLAPEMLDFIAEIRASVDDAALAGKLAKDLAFLHRCREIGVDAARDEAQRAAPPPPAHLAPALAELAGLSDEERLAYARSHPETLAALEEHGYARVVRSSISSIPDDPKLLDTFHRFFQADRLEEARPVLEEDADRLLEHGDALLDLVVEAGAHGDAAEAKIELYRELVRKCRERGIPAAFDELTAREAAKEEAHRQVLQIVNSGRLVDAYRLLDQGSGAALSDEAFEFLAKLLRQHAADEGGRTRIEFYRNFLRQVRSMGLRPAAALTLALSFVQADGEAQDQTFEEARAILSLEDMEQGFEEVVKVNAGHPASLLAIAKERHLLRRAWAMGSLEAAHQEREEATRRLLEAGTLLQQIADQPAGEGKEIVREHRSFLLAPATLTALEEFGHGPFPLTDGTPQAADHRRSFQTMVRLLHRCNEVGIDEAFDESRRLAEAGVAFLNASLDDRIAAVHSGGDLLLSEEMDVFLFDQWTRTEAGSGVARNIERWRQALRRCREGEAVETVFRETQSAQERQVLLGDVLFQMLEAQGLEAVRAIVAAHSDLLLGSAEAEEALLDMAQALAAQLPPAEAARARELSERYARLLRQGRARGTDAAFAAAEEEIRREHEELDRLAVDLEEVIDRLKTLSPGTRVRFFAVHPLIARRLRGLLPEESREERDAAVREELRDFWSLSSLEAKRLWLEEKPGLLLSEGADEVLAELIDVQEEEGPASFLGFHRRLLRRSREIGPAGAFAELMGASG